MWMTACMSGIALVVAGLSAEARAEEPPTTTKKPEATAPANPSNSDLRREASDEAARGRFKAPTTTPAQETPVELVLPPAPVLDKVKADAAKRLNAAVEVRSSERATWNDGSMGCPVPGEFYTQMITSGFQVLVASGSQVLDYRVANSGYFRLCSTAATPGSSDSSRIDR
jgi:hypothetical protein